MHLLKKSFKHVHLMDASCLLFLLFLFNLHHA